jgi:hypothetical protein
MKKEFVTYEQALALKELGFDDISWFDNQASLYDVNGEHTMYTNYGVMYSGLSYGYIPAPLKQQVFRWFRKKKLHNTFPSIIQTRNWATVYRILEWHPGNDSTSITTSDYYDTYEEAENACIDKLIELAKQ